MSGSLQKANQSASPIADRPAQIRLVQDTVLPSDRILDKLSVAIPGIAARARIMIPDSRWQSRPRGISRSVNGAESTLVLER